MATQGVILTIQQHQQTDVWLADRPRLSACTLNWWGPGEPGDPRYLAASWLAGQPTAVSLPTLSVPGRLAQRAGPVTCVVMAACVLVFSR
ncbi:hypothetical protein ACNKHK_22125 [Shigella flexneri]